MTNTVKREKVTEGSKLTDNASKIHQQFPPNETTQETGNKEIDNDEYTTHGESTSNLLATLLAMLSSFKVEARNHARVNININMKKSFNNSSSRDSATSSKHRRRKRNRRDSAASSNRQRKRRDRLPLYFWRVIGVFLSGFVGLIIYLYRQHSNAFGNELKKIYENKAYFRLHYVNDPRKIKNTRKMTDLFVPLSLVSQDDEEDNQDEEILPSYERPTEKSKIVRIEKLLERPIQIGQQNLPPIGKILIMGRASSGKSTLCKWLAYLYSQTPEKKLFYGFEVVFWMPLRKLLNDERFEREPKVYSLGTLVHYLCLDKNKRNEDEEKQLDNWITQHENRILWLLDGGDEIVSSDNKLHDSLMKLINNILSKPNVIFLTRPNTNHNFLYEPDHQYELKGFSEFDFPDKYVKKFFGEEDSQNSTGDVKTLLDFLDNSPSIRRLGFTPLNAELICAMWQRDRNGLKNMQRESTVTDLYNKFIEYIFRRELELQSELKREADKSKNQYNSLLIEKDKSGNPIFYDKDTWDRVAVFSTCKPVLHCLSLLAFHAQSHYETGKKLWFSDNLFDPVLTYCVKEERSRVPMRAIINRVGFLNIQKTGFEFTHLSFQEYLAAVYVAHCLQPENNKDLLLPSNRQSNFKDWFAQKKYLSEYTPMWEFTVGTLRQEYSQSGLQFFLEQWLSEPRDIFRLHEISLLIRFLNEGGSILDDKIKNPLIDYVFSFLSRFRSNGRQDSSPFYKAFSASPQLLAESRLINPVVNALKAEPPAALLNSLDYIKNLPEAVIKELINILLKKRSCIKCFEYSYWKPNAQSILSRQNPWFYPDTIPSLFKLLEAKTHFRSEMISLIALSYHFSIKSVRTNFIAILKDGTDRTIRLEVIKLLGEEKALSHSDTIPALITELQDSDKNDDKIRCAVALALSGQYGLSHSNAVSALADQLNNGHGEWLVCVVYALSSYVVLPSYFRTLLAIDDILEGHTDITAMFKGHMDIAAISEDHTSYDWLFHFHIFMSGLIFRYEEFGKHSAIKLQPDQIREFHKNITPIFITALEANNSAVAPMAAYALGSNIALSHKDTIPALITALEANNGAVALMAAYVLGSNIALSHKDTIPAFITALRSNHSAVASAAAYVLGSNIALSHEDTIPALITALRSNPKHGKNIVYALGKQHELSKDSIGVLIDIINNSSIKKSASEVLASHEKKLPERDVQRLIGMIAGNQSNADKLIAANALSGQNNLSNNSVTFLIKAIKTECEDTEVCDDIEACADIKACEDIKATTSYILSQQTELLNSTIITLLESLKTHKNNILAKKYLIAALSNQLALKREDVISELKFRIEEDEHDAVREMAILVLESYPFALSKYGVKKVLIDAMSKDPNPNVKMAASKVLRNQSDLKISWIAPYIDMLKEKDFSRLNTIEQKALAPEEQGFFSELDIKFLVNETQQAKGSNFLQQNILILLEMQMQINTRIIKYLLRLPKLSYPAKLIADICYNLNQKVTLNQRSLCVYPMLKDCIELNDMQWSELQSAFQSKVNTLQLPDYNFISGHFVDSNQITESFVPSTPSPCNFTDDTTFPNPFLMSAPIPDFLHTFMLGLVLKQLGKTTYSYLKSSYQLLKFWWFGDEEALKLHRAKRQVYERYQLGQDCMEEKQWDKAEAHFKVAIELIQSFNFNMYKTECYMALGFTLLEKAHILLDSPYEIDSSITEDEEVSLIDKARDAFLAVKGVSQENDEVIKEELDKLAKLYKSCAQPVLAHRCREKAKQLASEIANVNDGLIYVEQLAHESTAGIAAQLGIFAYAKKAPTVILSKGNNLNTLGKN